MADYRTNIYDIAKLSGVSIATVSRVLNGSDKVSEKTRAKVMKAIESSNYTPNVFARGLGMDSMKTVGILCPNINDAFIAHAVANIESSLHKYGYDCILSCSDYSRESKESHLKLLIDKRIDALVLVGSTYAESGENPEATDYIKNAAEKTPVFLINGRIDHENIYCSFCDDYTAMYDVTMSNLKNGKRKIMYLSDSHSYSALRKLAGYRDAIRDFGDDSIKEFLFYTENRIHQTRDVLKAHDFEFDAVAATDDGLAIGALKYVKSKGLRIPEDVIITGYNNSQLSVSSEPELTSIDNHIDVICTDMVDLMQRVLKGDKDVDHCVEVACTLKVRKTTNSDFIDKLSTVKPVYI